MEDLTEPRYKPPSLKRHLTSAFILVGGCVAFGVFAVVAQTLGRLLRDFYLELILRGN
jgi:hypothetical protein